MLRSNSETLRKVLKADFRIHSREPSCWTAQILDGFEGMQGCESFKHAVRQGDAISIQEFADALKHRLRAVWSRVDVQDTSNKLSTYKSLFAVPYPESVQAPICLPRHLYVDLPQHVLSNVSRFRLRSHRLKVETASWSEENSPVCDRCPADSIQDEVHALFLCSDAGVCALRRKYAFLFSEVPGFSIEQAFVQHHVSAQVAIDFLLQHNNKLFFFLSELTDLLMAGEDQSQTDQPNVLAEGPPM